MRRRIPDPVRQRIVGSMILMMHSGRVASGPFASMKLQWEAAGSSFYPKLTGAYEYELHEVWEWVVQKLRPSVIIDIGAAEGYYAIGLARALPNSKVIAYEANERSLNLLRNAMRLNCVSEQIFERGFCGIENLNRDLAECDDTLVICDTEGFERTLIDPAAVPRLRNAYIVVETHDGGEPGVMQEIKKRFSGTHTIETIACELDRDSQSFRLGPFGQFLPSDWRFRLLCERMIATPWLWMRPNR